MSSPHYILCLNSGSSSLKYALYRMAREEETLLAHGAAESIGLAGGRTWIRSGKRETSVEFAHEFKDHQGAVRNAFEQLKSLHLPGPTAVGHRVVHGGSSHFEAIRVDQDLLSELRRISAFAPLHLPAEIEGIEAVTSHFPGLTQIACFDTAFHRGMPDVAQRLPLPRQFWDEGVKRYGFHGLSYEYVLESMGTQVEPRLIIAHLGNGASLAAIHRGRPVDTTMGFTPVGGFMMGTRSGDIDPGVLLYLMNVRGYTSGQIEDLVNHHAGLLGVSGASPDMQTLLEMQGRNPNAALAVEMFCYQVRKSIGAMAAALGGLDSLVFTGGIGENAAPVRREICRDLAYLGIELDHGRNEVHADPISAPGSDCPVRVIRTNEDLIIARQTFRLVAR